MSLEQMFLDIAEHTRPKCGECRVPHACCNSQMCLDTIEMARQFFGVTLETTNHPTLPLMGANGCTAAPHHRPICSVHVCEGHFKDDAWEEKYWDLRAIASDALEDIVG